MTTYQVKPYNTVQVFLNETEHLLENDVIMNTFPLWASTDLAMIKENTSPQYYNSIWKNNGKELIYVFVCVSNTMYIGWCGHDREKGHEQIPSDIETTELQMILQNLLKDCYEKIGNTLEYIHGYSPLSFYIYEQWKLITIPNYDKTSMDSAIYQHPKNHMVWFFELTSSQRLIYKETTNDLLPKTYLRLATMDDLDLLADWVKQFLIDCNMPLNDGDGREIAQTDIEKKNAYLWCDQITNQPLGTIWKRRSLKNKSAVSLAYVYVPKQYRSKGFAATMVTQFSLFLLNEEKYQTLTLLMDGRRDPFKNLYASIGYQPLGTFARLYL